MSLQLLNLLCGNTNGLLREFISRFDGKEPNMLWYPSAGFDFRPLLYVTREYSTLNRTETLDPVFPDLYLFTDYLPVTDQSQFLDKPLLHCDLRTHVQIVGEAPKYQIEELPKLNLPLYEDLTVGIQSSALNRVVYMNVNVYSDKLGAQVLPILYCFCENTAFYKEVLLPANAMISHLVHVRYGGGLGGMGTASGVWLLKTLAQLKTKVLITDNHYYWQHGDNFALELIPQLKDGPDPGLTPYRTLEGIKWSNHGDVTWNLVHTD